LLLISLWTQSGNFWIHPRSLHYFPLIHIIKRNIDRLRTLLLGNDIICISFIARGNYRNLWCHGNFVYCFFLEIVLKLHDLCYQIVLKLHDLCYQ
jgi:hypothetical protein